MSIVSGVTVTVWGLAVAGTVAVPTATPPNWARMLTVAAWDGACIVAAKSAVVVDEAPVVAATAATVIGTSEVVPADVRVTVATDANEDVPSTMDGLPKASAPEIVHVIVTRPGTLVGHDRELRERSGPLASPGVISRISTFLRLRRIVYPV